MHGGSAHAPFLAPAWVDGALSDLSARELAVAGSRQLRRGAGLGAQLDVALGREVGRFVSRWKVKSLGYSRPEDFAPERLGCSWSHLLELCHVAEGLESLPRLRDAYFAGALTRSKVREVIRVATPETDAGWARVAACLSVRELKRAIADSKAHAQGVAPRQPDDLGEDEENGRAWWRTSALNAAIWKGWGRPMVRAHLGRRAADAEIIEVLAAETLTSLEAPEVPAADGLGVLMPTDASLSRPPRRKPLTLDDLRRRGRKRRVFTIPPMPAVPDGSSCRDAWEHLEVLQAIQRMRHQLAFERGSVLANFQGRRLHRELGLTEHQHVELVLGMSPQDAKLSVELQLRLASLPLAAAAWRAGDISEGDAWTLSRVAMGGTEGDWLSHARKCSRVRLEAEIDWHVAVRELIGWEAYLEGTRGLPDPNPRQAASFELDWREMFGCWERARAATEGVGLDADEREVAGAGEAELRPGVEGVGEADAVECVDGSGVMPRMGEAGPRPPFGVRERDAVECVEDSGVVPRMGEAGPRPYIGSCCDGGVHGESCASDPDSSSDSSSEPDDPDVPWLREKRVVVGISAPASVIALFQEAIGAVRAAHGTSLDVGDCVRLMLIHFASVHGDVTHERRLKDYAIFERDGWRCSMPHCQSRGPLHAHHVVFRSRGGPDDAWNLITLCDDCHELLHDGYVSMEGRAPDDLVVLVAPRGDGTARERWAGGLRLDDEPPAPPKDPADLHPSRRESEAVMA